MPMRMRHIVICGLSGSIILYFSTLSTGFSKEKKITEHKMCLVSSTNWLKLQNHKNEDMQCPK